MASHALHALHARAAVDKWKSLPIQKPTKHHKSSAARPSTTAAAGPIHRRRLTDADLAADRAHDRAHGRGADDRKQHQNDAEADRLVRCDVRSRHAPQLRRVRGRPLPEPRAQVQRCVGSVALQQCRQDVRRDLDVAEGALGCVEEAERGAEGGNAVVGGVRRRIDLEDLSLRAEGDEAVVKADKAELPDQRLHGSVA